MEAEWKTVGVDPEGVDPDTRQCYGAQYLGFDLLVKDQRDCDIGFWWSVHKDPQDPRLDISAAVSGYAITLTAAKRTAVHLASYLSRR